MKFNELGRSMVEMLGVLAIIGVLSVGAISGYSKAMFKYKLNKQAEQISALLFAVQQGIQGYTLYEGKYITEYFKKLNLLPEGITEKGNYIYDSLGNQIALYSATNKKISLVIPTWNSALSKDTMLQSCWQIMQAVKEYQDSPNLMSLMVQAGKTVLYYYSSYWFSCKSNQCLNQTSIEELRKTCSDFIYSDKDIFGSEKFQIWINFSDK